LLALTASKDEVACSVTRYDGSDHPVDGFTAVVAVSWTPLNYGTKRAWLHCKGCSRRCTLLYVVASQNMFACRECAGLEYRSRYDSRGARKRQAARIRASLGRPDLGSRTPTRPKGMHQETFERKMQELRQLTRRK
jgi:hypothetical protein